MHVYMHWVCLHVDDILAKIYSAFDTSKEYPSYPIICSTRLYSKLKIMLTVLFKLRCINQVWYER